MALTDEMHSGRRKPIPVRNTSTGIARVTFSLDDLVPMVFDSSKASLAFSLARRYRLHGALDEVALQRAFSTVIARHEALRTRFVLDGHRVLQRIDDPPDEFPINVLDVSSFDKKDPEQDIELLLQTSSRKPFDLSREHPLRIFLYQCGPDEYVLHLIVHHLLFDGRSMQLLWKEVAACYEAYCQQLESPLKPPRLQFADFSEWQRDWTYSSEARPSVDYWISKLQGSSEGSTFHATKPALLSNGQLERWLPQSIVKGMVSVAVKCKVSFAAVALAAYNLVLAIDAGQTDVIVGVPMANRRRRPSNDCMGFLVNTHAIRVTIDPSQSLLYHVVETARALSDAQSHQEMPLAFVLREVIERDLQGFPEILFRNLFIFHTLKPLRPFFSSVSFEQQPNPSTGGAMADVALQVLRSPDGLLCQFQWDIETFNTHDIQRLADLYERACRQLASPTKSILTALWKL